MIAAGSYAGVERDRRCVGHEDGDRSDTPATSSAVLRRLAVDLIAPSLSKRKR
jgi:hypothetical protein